MSVNIQHNVILFGQPTGMTCWSAATTMLLGTNRSVSSGAARTGGDGGLNSGYNNVKIFAQTHGLQIHPMQSWTAGGLIELIQRGPFAIIGGLPTMHAVVVGGVQSDGTENGTTLTIFDPWPVGTGSYYRRNYDSMMREFPLATIYILQK
jgi:hypothetical protein